MLIKKDSTDVITYFKLVDPTTGVPETGLTITDLDATYVRDGAEAVKADLTALAAADSSHSDNKAYEVNSTYAPGLYRVDWPDAAFATGVNRVTLCVSGAAIAPAFIDVELTDYNIGEANLIEINGDSVTDNSATLKLKQLSIVNASGNAVIADGTIGIYVKGSVYGVLCQGDSAFRCEGVSSGIYANADGTGGKGVDINGDVGISAAEIDAIPASTKTAIEAAGSHLALIKAQTDLIPANPAEAGEYTSAIADVALEATAQSIKTQTDLIPASPAEAGEYTADIASIDTKVDAVKVKTDQLEFTASTVNANIATGGIGTGAKTVNYYVYTNESAKTGAIANVAVWVSTDEAGTTIIAQGETDSDGKVTFYLDDGTYYFWRSKTGYTFTNPDEETVS